MKVNLELYERLVKQKKIKVEYLEKLLGKNNEL
jgi:hypothetical protein